MPSSFLSLRYGSATASPASSSKVHKTFLLTVTTSTLAKHSGGKIPNSLPGVKIWVDLYLQVMMLGELVRGTRRLVCGKEGSGGAEKGEGREERKNRMPMLMARLTSM